MAYIGSTPTTQSFISGTDYFNGTGSQTAFTLSRTVNSVNDIEVVINNVVQQPNTAYTLSGTTITFNSAPSTGTSNIYVRYLSTTTQVITPSQDSVNTASIQANAVTPAKLSQPLTQGTAVASTSGTSIDFTGIPSWVKRITVNFSGISFDISADYLVQIGSGSISNTGYTSLTSYSGAGSGRVSNTTGFIFVTSTAPQAWSGSLTICLLSGNTYIQSGVVADGVNYTSSASGTKTLSGTLDRIRITTAGGTANFDAGTINILYE